MFITTRALVLRSADYGESSRMLTLLTEESGKISAAAKGVKRRNSRLASVSQLYTFSEMTLAKYGSRWYVSEGSVIELFRGIGESLEKLALAAYFSELMETMSREEIAEDDILRLGLNTFYALSNSKKPPEVIKAAFELRLMCVTGYSPPLDSCAQCGREEPEKPVLALDGDGLMCSGCASGRQSAPLCADSLRAARYIARAEVKKLFSFTLSRKAAGNLSKAAEKYVQSQLERGFRTLDYYKNLEKGNDSSF